jgi:thiosulfate reductase cytochrome b subunit
MRQHLENKSHKVWVKYSHWIITLSFFALTITGFEMIMVHPRFYWGEVGNDLTPALFELPVSRNYRHGGWTKSTAFFDNVNSPVTAGRTFEDELFNQNSWGRSLHFLSGWFLVVVGLYYLVLGFWSGHIYTNLWLRMRDLNPKLFWADVMNHVRMNLSPASYGPNYGLLQKISYLVVIFFLMPLMVMTGMTMSPAITAAYPFLLKIFFGAQSARTIHLFASAALVLFLVVHLVMIIKTGFKQHIRFMTIGK